MKRNEEKLDQMVEAVISNANESPVYGAGAYTSEEYPELYEISDNAWRERLRTALTPFCMEMTDEEIMNEAEKRFSNSLLQSGFMMGAKFIRDGK